MEGCLGGVVQDIVDFCRKIVVTDFMPTVKIIKINKREHCYRVSDVDVATQLSIDPFEFGCNELHSDSD